MQRKKLRDYLALSIESSPPMPLSSLVSSTISLAHLAHRLFFSLSSDQAQIVNTQPEQSSSPLSLRLSLALARHLTGDPLALHLLSSPHSRSSLSRSRLSLSRISSLSLSPLSRSLTLKSLSLSLADTIMLLRKSHENSPALK
ncbi:hypothetical protein Tco_1205275 [Tanacetum coccineum]